jgi:mRNA interferase RelE/StbE
VKYAEKLSARAVKDLDALDDKLKKRMLDRIAELADAPYDPKLSIKLTNQGGLRRSRVAGWRIIFLVDDKAKTLSVVTIERRGQVYKRM